VQKRHGVGEIDDVDTVARSVDEGFHLGIPTMGLVAEVNARFEELTHSEFWRSHYQSSFSG
jgi:hypothetical protein